ncbi:hypothetical protein [Photobacterium damselae]|uniref:hypothetical protein n=1 Tax=Photobacterium damselae TaxID=38293 RepID=UPI00406815A2
MSFYFAESEKSEYRKGCAKVVTFLLMRWALFWLEIAVPILVFGYFYYSIMMNWHFVFFAVILSGIWCGCVYKAIDIISGARRYLEMLMLDGYDQANSYSDKGIPEWIVDGTCSVVMLVCFLIVGYFSGFFSHVWSAWSQYPLPAKDPIAGFWHVFLIYF